MKPGIDRQWLAKAIELSGRCPPTETAFCVGAILVSASGQVIAQAHSRQADPNDHAEEAALREAAALGADLREATLYSSLEPCLRRVSRPTPCAELILRSGVQRVVFAWREPPIFQPGGGAEWLAEHGVEVIELADLAAAARAVNRPVLDRRLSIPTDAAASRAAGTSTAAPSRVRLLLCGRVARRHCLDELSA